MDNIIEIKGKKENIVFRFILFVILLKKLMIGVLYIFIYIITI